MNKDVPYDGLIKSISFDNKEILYNIMNLHNNGEAFECDMTYSSGKFYSTKQEEFFIPQPRLKFDVSPLFDDVCKIEPNGCLPLEDNSLKSIVIDLPFVITTSTAPSLQKIDSSNNVMIRRFANYDSIHLLVESYYHWLKEAFRVLKNDGICVFKTQGTITSSKQLFTPEISWFLASMIGFYPLDQFFLIAKNRMHSGKIKKQQHARKFTSTFYVFKKTDRMKIKVNDIIPREIKENVFK